MEVKTEMDTTPRSIENNNPDYCKDAEKTALVRLCGVLGVLTENNDLATAALLAATRIERLEKKIPALNVDLAEASMHAYNGEIARMKLETRIAELEAERKEFCPNCEAETPCTHEAELFVCDICGEDFAKYIVSRNCTLPDVSMTQDVTTEIQKLNARIAKLEAENERLSQLLHDEMSQLEIATDLGNKRWAALKKVYEDGDNYVSK